MPMPKRWQKKRTATKTAETAARAQGSVSRKRIQTASAQSAIAEEKIYSGRLFRFKTPDADGGIGKAAPFCVERRRFRYPISLRRRPLRLAEPHVEANHPASDINPIIQILRLGKIGIRDMHVAAAQRHTVLLVEVVPEAAP